MSIVATARRLFFTELWGRHHFRGDLLAFYADVPENVIYAMLARRPVPKEYAQKVLDYLSREYHEHYTFDTVEVKLYETNAQRHTTNSTGHYCISQPFY